MKKSLYNIEFEDLRNFMLERAFHYKYSEWNFHLRLLLNWYRYEKIVNEIRRLVPQGFLLDIGCGFGQITEMLHIKGIRVIGADIGENKVWKHLSSSFTRGDGCKLPFKESVFDAIICCGVLEHVHNQREFLNECRRLLKNNGFFLCYYLPNKMGLESLFSKVFSTDHIFFNRNDIKILFRECGYDVFSITNEHIIPQLRFGCAIELQNKLYKILSSIDETVINTPLRIFGDNWRVYARKMTVT